MKRLWIFYKGKLLIDWLYSWWLFDNQCIPLAQNSSCLCIEFSLKHNCIVLLLCFRKSWHILKIFFPSDRSFASGKLNWIVSSYHIEWTDPKNIGRTKTIWKPVFLSLNYSSSRNVRASSTDKNFNFFKSSFHLLFLGTEH